MQYQNFNEALHDLFNRFPSKPNVHTERWQAMDISNRPEAAMHEILHTSFTVPLNRVEDLDHYRRDIQPNLPWADDHFLERVCGEPLNPGVQHANWPYAFHGKKSLHDNNQYSHSYMERLWPKYAGVTPDGRLPNTDDPIWDVIGPNSGIRFPYGDLSDLVELLHEEPHTRQAFIPLWFPEDTSIENKTRKPCTIGYWFIQRQGRLDITYPIRSCDFLRHFQDDIYMAIRLLLWVLGELRKRNPVFWNDVVPGTYVMNIGSLHMFVNDYRLLSKKFKSNVL